MLGQTRTKVYIGDGTSDDVAGVDTSKRLKVTIQGEDSQRSDMEGGGKVSVGTTAIEVTFSGTPTHTIVISADVDNTGLLFVGKSNVTNTGANAMAFLDAGDSIILNYDDSSNAVFVVADAASQNFWKGTLL